MITVLIADDERMERQGLSFLLRKKGYEARMLEAENGLRALEMLEQEPVDILISDIKMPFMDGLALAEQARLLQPDLIILIYSAYGEFEYARQAIQVNVLAYLLKPLAPSQFYLEMDRAFALHARNAEQAALKAKMEDYRQLDRFMRERYWYDLIHGRPPVPEIQQRMQAMGILPRDMFPALMLVTCPEGFFSEHTEAFEAEIGAQADGCWVLDAGSALLLLTTDAFPEDAALIARGKALQGGIAARFAVTPSVLIARGGDSAASLGETYAFLDAQSEQRLFKPGSVVLLSGNTAGADSDLYERLAALRAGIRQALAADEIPAAQGHLQALEALLQSTAEMSALYVKHALTEIAEDIRAYLGAGEDPRAMLESVWRADSVTPLLALVARYGHALGMATPPAKVPANEVMERVFALIHARYGEELTLEEIAGAAYMTPSHLSYFFKRHTGQTLIKYLTRYRLARAAALLEEGRLRVTEVMAAVGYNNASYFGSLFRGAYGETPSQYRKRHKGGGVP